MMAVKKFSETTDVLIIGCGPTGAILSALLSEFAVPVIVLEKQAAITEDPRGITLDEDGIRLLQAVGLYDKVYTEIGSPIGRANFITSKDDLQSRPFMTINLDTTEGGTGHIGAISHRQPVLEKYLRLAATRTDYSQIRSSCTVTQIDEDDDWVYCQYSDASGNSQSIRAKFVVGADGKTGFTRKKYLEPKGVQMEQSSSFHYKETWVALNLKLTPPTEETHPDLPFWKLGYTPEQVYEEFFPKDFRFICNAERPAVCGRFGNGEQRLWRFEFVVKQDEDPLQMASSEKTMEIILPYLTLPGSKYGSNLEVQFPLDCVDVLRSRPFAFSARNCNKWSVGRVLLAGDAAHVFPPFGGQGISSGFRDASGLAWRLAVACRGNAKNHEHLFSSWYRERRQQLQQSLASTVANGRLCTEGNTWRFLFLQMILRFVQLIPTSRRWLEMGARREGMIRYQWQDGLPFLAACGGVCLPQVYCAPIDSSSKGSEVQFTDDVIFQRDKQGLFQVVVLLNRLSELGAVRKSILDLKDRLSSKYVHAKEATFIVQTAQVGPCPRVGADVFRLATGAEFAANETLCKNRPPPLYYDMYQIKKELRGKRFAIVRPDRFVYAACDSVEQLAQICEGVQRAQERNKCPDVDLTSAQFGAAGITFVRLEIGLQQITRTHPLYPTLKSILEYAPPAVYLLRPPVFEDGALDTLIRHTKSHTTGGGRRRESDASTDPEGRVATPGVSEAPGLLPPELAVQNLPAYPQPWLLHGDQIAPAHSADDLEVLARSETTHKGMTDTAESAAHEVLPVDPLRTSTRAWDFSDMQFTEDFPVWAIHGGFSVDTFNLAATALENDVQDMQMLDPELSNRAQNPDSKLSEFTLPPPVVNLENIWFTKVQDVMEQPRYLLPFSTAPTDPVPQQDVGDQYRQHLSKSLLHPAPQDDPLPSSDFLNLCVSRYFTCFNPLFPILHSATFRPTPENGLLLLSMASVGCLFLGSQAAVRRGEQIFEKVNKAVLASDARHIAIFETFHGGVVSFARREKMLGPQPTMLAPVGDLTDVELETSWILWARREEISRISPGLRIHDSEMSALLHHEPSLRQVASEVPSVSTTRLFSATTASKWASIMRDESTAREGGARSINHQEDNDSFSRYVILEGFGTLIAEDRRQGRLDDAALNAHHRNLLNWYGFFNGEQPDNLCLMMLWHWTYMCLLVDFDQLERAIGRDGPEAVGDALDYVSKWVSSSNSTRCVLHALLSQRCLQSFRFDKVMAIHVPRVMFSAAVAWYCYFQYGLPHDVTPLFREVDIHFPEFAVLGPTAHKHLSNIARFSWKHGDMSALKAATLCEIGDSLQRMSHWGIAGAFAKIVARLIYGGPEEAITW
ncbi:hypothetical protein V500_00813 [Pseudogymnoascus sp. VKM F-4518 (FW-2643)]|nr:hypothetical protein V500_00813 [Pseudogymnoascus sp. VKM F-4518 (FW-2643)]